jgi:hypothetical protein
VADAGSAITAVPPRTGVVPAVVVLLLEQAATTSAQAAALAATARDLFMPAVCAAPLDGGLAVACRAGDVREQEPA